ncbi:MAG: 2-C-methyl-D-erythritol 4-phosphate cytidylyltransferase [Hyphomicrobiales bacterium]
MGPSVAAVVVAAGRGLRAGGGLPKQYRDLAGEPVIRSSLALFSWHGQIGQVQAVIHGDDRGSYDAAAKGLRLLPPVLGGASRQASVRAGLEALNARPPDIVLVHDAARPFCSAELVSRAISACSETGAAIPREANPNYDPKAERPRGGQGKNSNEERGKGKKKNDP